MSITDQPNVQSITFSNLIARIMVGLVAFLAMVLLILPGSGKTKKAKEEEQAKLIPCPTCGHRLRIRPKAMSKTANCPACDSDFDPSAVPATVSVADNNEEIKKWVMELARDRKKRPDRG